MKTISKRFLKGGLALLLAFVMLFGTTLTGFAAVVDNADTSANVDVADTDANVDVAESGLTIPSGSGNLVMFNNTLGWSNVYLYTRSTDLWNGNNGCTTSGLTAKTMTKISGTNYWYAYISTSYKYVLFLKDKQDNYGNVWNTSATYRADYSTSRPCFTPVPWSNQNTNSTNYYSKGSWSKFDDTTTELTIPSGSGNLVIFNNTLGWTEVYFYSKSSNFYTNSNGCSTSGMTGTRMTNISGTNYWYIYTSTTSHMLFLKAKQDGYGNVWDTAAVYKEDYNTDRQIFTPSTTAVETANSTSYYSNGTWSKYIPAATKYTVEFVDYNGTVLSTQEVEEGKTPTAPANPTRTGYTFAGWSPTVGAVTGDTTYTATYTQNTYKLTINESGTTGGTFTIDGNSFTSGSNVTHGTHTLGVTAPAGYKITSINGGTANPATINVTGATTIAVVYEVDNKCSTSFADTSTMNLVLGGEGTRTATLSHCTSGGTVNYSSSDTTVATVDANGKVKALKAGTTTITAKCSKGDEGSSATYTVKVNNPTFSVDDVTVDVNGTVSAVPTITANEPVGTYSIKYTTHVSNPNYYAVTEDGKFTGLKPGTAIANAELVYGGESVAFAESFNVKVNNVDVELNKSTAKILKGQTVQLSVTSDITPKSISWSKDTVVTVDTNGKVSTTADTGTGNVTATVKYNDYYTEELTCAVTVASPTLTVSPATLNLEVGGGTTEGTVTVTNNDTAGADGTDAVAPVLAVTSSKPDVATATVADGKINVTAKAVGTTTLTVSYRNVTKEVTVNVAQYDPYVYLYVTDSQDWGNMFLHSWKGSNSNVTTLGQSNAQMIYIGRNGDDDKVFAYRFLKGSEPEKVIMVKTNSWPSDNLTRTDDYSVDFSKGYAALYIDSTTNSSGRRNTGDWTDDCMIVRPTVSVEDLTVIMGETGTAEATVSNGDKVLWSIADTTYATVANVETKTATVTSVAPGTTEISARAFVDTANSSIKELPTNYKTDTACWPFISTEATATVTVDPGSARQITVASSYSNNGTDYSTGVTGGTVNATYEAQSGTSLEVPYNGEYTITATPKDGYAFNGWTKNNEDIEGGATLTVAAKDDANYVAKFVKTYTVTVATPTGIDSIKINNAPGTTYTAKAGETITVYGSPSEGYRLGDWTVGGTATATGTNTATATISNIQSNITVTPSAVKIYTVTYDQYVNRVNADVGTVTVNGSTDNDQEFDAGTEITLVATSTNRAFYGWYAADDTNFETPLSTDATYVIDSLDSNIDVVAMFYRPFTIEGNVPGSQVVLTYDIVTDTYTGTSNDYKGATFTVKDTFNNTAAVADVNVTGGNHTGATVTGNASGYTLVPDTDNYDPSAPITYTMRHMGTGTYYLDIALSDAEKVNISVNGTKVAEKPIGSTFNYEIEAPEGQYLTNGTTITPAVDFTIEDNTIIFTVPDSNVNIVPAFADYSYVKFDKTSGLELTGYKDGYKAGERVEITVESANDATTISDVKADTPAVVTNNNDGTFTITVDSMPERTTINVKTTVDTKYIMDYGMKAIGNYGTGYTTYGTVSMKIGSTTLAKGGYAAPTDTVTYTATPNTNFIFDGWYSAEGCQLAQLLSRETSYSFKPNKDTTIYALFVPKHYMAYNGNNTGSYVTMNYDPEKRMFTHESLTISTTAHFRVTNNLNGWSDDQSYHRFGSEFSVSMNAKGGDLSISWGNDSIWVLNAGSANYPITFGLTINGNESVDISATTGAFGDKIYLSAGRVDLQTGDYNSSDFDADTTLIDSDLAVSDKKFVYDGSAIREAYRTATVSEPQNITFQTVISGTTADRYTVDSFVVYHINSGSYEVVTPNPVNSTTFQGTVYVDGPCFICPVYFITDEYAEENGLSNIDILFDRSAIQNLNWGPFVACYAWGTSGADYLGSWTGQMMIPTADGKSFYTQLTVPAYDSENRPSVPNGVTFNNYMQATVPGAHAAAFGISSTQYQCYDYREPLTLYEQGYEVISFVVKDSKDGYHGDNPVNQPVMKNVTTSTNALNSGYVFDYLYARDAETPMDLNGDEIEGVTKSYDSNGSVNNADYYIIAKGDRRYWADKHGYQGDPAYEGKWSVEWFVFDNTGKHLTTMLSDSFYNDYDEDETHLLHELGLTDETAARKVVAISYEKANDWDEGEYSHQITYDGQWYGNMLDHTVTGQVMVGFTESTSTSLTSSDVQLNPETEKPNIADYGEGYLRDDEGNLHQTLDIIMESGVANLVAKENEGYVFVGWYTMDANGNYTKIPGGIDLSTYINFDETYYAIFREIAEGQVVINHRKYNNPDDPYIYSHGGTSTMTVEVTMPDNTVKTSTPNTSNTSVLFEGEEGETYKVKITTTPLMNGKFFAWYTDSTTADGTNTYEEVFTDELQVGSTSTVVAEFNYKFTSTSPRTVNIYSDIVPVTNKASIQYRYKNRFDQWRTYTVKDIVLSDDECMGFEGNGNNAYVPAYKTLYKFDVDGKTVEAYEGTDDYNKYIDSHPCETFNKVTHYAPKDDVTEVFDGTVTWDISQIAITPIENGLQIVAKQDTPTYTLNYSWPNPDGNGVVSGNYQDVEYNTLVNITAPATVNGNDFSYWYEPATGEILTYSVFYNYRVVENKTIEAVYGVTNLQEWVPSINSVTYTREFGDDGDYIYNDFLLAFNNTEAKEIETALKNGEVTETGLLILREAGAYISDPSDISYPDATDTTTQGYLEKVARDKKRNMAIPVDGGSKKYNCYYYNLSACDYTNLNRLNYFIQYDNNAVIDDGTHKYYECAYTAVAYIIIGETVYLSKPKTAEFYDLGMKVPTTN